MKHILIVCSHFWPSRGGLESRMGQFAAELIAYGYRVTVLTNIHPERVSNEFQGVLIQSLAANEFTPFIRSSVQSGLYHACILVQDPLGEIIWSIEGLTTNPNTRILIQPIINADGYESWKNDLNFEKRLAKILTEVGQPLVMTKSGPDTHYMKKYQLPSIYIPNATSITPSAGDFRSQYGIRKDHFLILHVANLFWVKNHSGLMDSLSDLPESWKLVMIGNPTGEPDCVNFVYQKLSNRPDILFIPGLPREWISAAMEAANAVVLASKGEGSPITILEAMSHKKPWIATPECGAANDHLGGFICRLSEFKKYLNAIKESPSCAQQLGLVSYEHWMKCYSWPVVIRGWVELIEQGNLNHDFLPDDKLIKRMAQIQSEIHEIINSTNIFSAENIIDLLSNHLDENTVANLKDGKFNLFQLVEVAQELIKSKKFSLAAFLYQYWIYKNESTMIFAAYYNLGTIFENLGELYSARKAYENSIKLNPSFELAMVGLKRVNLSLLEYLNT